MKQNPSLGKGTNAEKSKGSDDRLEIPRAKVRTNTGPERRKDPMLSVATSTQTRKNSSNQPARRCEAMVGQINLEDKAKL